MQPEALPPAGDWERQEASSGSPAECRDLSWKRRSSERLDGQLGRVWTWRQGVCRSRDGDQAGRLLPVRDRPAGHPCPPEVGHAAAWSTSRRGRRGSASTTNASMPSSPCSASSSRTRPACNLTQGPITVFDGSNYAGDARILDLQPNEERLLSYAIDLGTEVEAVPHADNGRRTAVKILKGILLHDQTKVREIEDLHAEEPLRAGPPRPDRAPLPPRIPSHQHRQARWSGRGRLSLPGQACPKARRSSRP